MRIEDLILEPLEIPFKTVFKHNSAERSKSESIIIKARSSKIYGYGEACPREYVTGENIETVIEFFKNHKKEILKEIFDLNSLKIFMHNYQELIDKNPSAWCAIELAILDLFAKDNKESIEKFLGLDVSKSFQYTAVIGDYPIEVFDSIVEKHLELGFTDFKIKLSGSFNLDQTKFEHLRGKNLKLRADANNLWHKAKDCINYLQPFKKDLWALEEPLEVNQYPDLALVGSELNLEIILDESFLRIDQIEKIKIIPRPVVNLRISKMGGLLRSLTLMEKLKEKNIPLIVGAQVGETSLLTRAATLINDTRIRGREGAYGDLLLSHDPFSPCLKFREKGILNLDSLKDSYGFGLSFKD